MPADPDILVPLTTARTEFEGSTLRAVLEAEGIDARVFAGSANALGWEGGYTDPIKVMVRRADAVRAAEAIATNRRTSRMVDWSTVDVGLFEDGDAPGPVDYQVRRIRRARIRRAGLLLFGLSLIAPRFGTEGVLLGAVAFVVVMALSWNDDV